MQDMEGIKYPRGATVFASVCAIIFCVVGVIGNLVTILALCRCQKLRSHATTAFVLSLCISDLLFCALNLPLTASRYIHEEWTLGDGLCKLFPVLFYGNVAVSLLNMVAITLSRYVLIAYNKHYDFMYSQMSIWLQLGAAWGFAFLIMLPPLLGFWGRLGLHAETFSCTILADEHGRSPKKFIFLLGFVLPCVVIVISYTCIYWKVKKSRNNIKQHRLSTNDDKVIRRREKEDSRLTKLMWIIFVCFSLCFLPLMLMNVFDDAVRYPIFHVLASILAWASSVINPFIYAASNRQYRSAYFKLLRIIKSSVAVTDSRQLSNSLKTRVTEKNGQSVNFKPNAGLS